MMQRLVFTVTRCLLQVLTATVWLIASPAQAQDTYPSRPLSLIVPFPPGGVADTVGRPVADAKSRPGAITFGSSGNYGTMHVPIEMLKQASGAFMVHVPYTGAGPAVVGLLGGQVDALATGPSTIVQHVRSGRLRALAHWGEGRLAALPEVPSLKELGYPVVFSQWAGLFAPAGTPEPVIARLRETARRAADDERVVRTIATAGSPMQHLDAPEFARFVQADAAVMAGVVKRIGKQ